MVYFHEASTIYEALQSTDVILKCFLSMAVCYKSLKNFGKVIETFGKAEELCSTCKTLDERIILRFHEEMADVFTEEECEDRGKALEHLQEAAAILKRIKQTENDEETFDELQAKISSLQLA